MTKSKNVFSKIWRALPFFGPSDPLVTVIELSGVIGAAGPGRKGLSLQKTQKAIADAFKPAGLTCVALIVNSPGGSPVQSRLIFSEIRRQAQEKDVPVLTFIEDAGASGGYILALAGDEIYADESSVVGSIGVISGGFGFADAIEKLGVERRVYTAGENKSMLDPFKPEDPKEIERLQTILTDLHEQFVDMVKTRRGDKLIENSDHFSGMVWTGKAAVKEGLIDGTAHFDEFIRTRFGKDVKIKKMSPDSGSLLKRLMSGGDAGFGVGSERGLMDPEAVLNAAEERAHWARFGL